MPEMRVQLLVKDPNILKWKDVHPTEPLNFFADEPMLPGPVSARVAILDFDENGSLRPGARFKRPTRPGQLGTYVVGPPPAPGEPLNDPSFLQVSVFGTIYKTLTLFEESDALGRKVSWAFGAPQLLVVPAAGEWANAFYERNSHSLQFFYFTGPDGKRIYTSHSQDIIAHETAHAIVDGVLPDLYDALSPQSLALHEALADITAVIMAFRSPQLRKKVLAVTGGKIDDASAFSGIAEQFAGALELNNTRGYLRDLRNNKILGPEGQGFRRAHGEAVSRSEPHALSEVLSGALYELMMKLYEKLKDERAEREVSPQKRELWKDPRSRGAAEALYVATQRFKRLVMRGLDYLPPGEVSFADFGRAMLAADRASHEDSPEQREWLQQIFIARGIVERSEDLEVPVQFEEAAVSALDLEDFIASDWLAYRFAEANRKLLAIPEGVTFVVKPRLKVTKTYYYKNDKKQEVTECLFKVSWSQTEENTACPDLAKERRITVGTTLAIDWTTRTVKAVLTSRPEDEQASRDELLSRLLATGALRFGEEALAPDGQLLPSAILGQVVNGTLRVRGAARMLHVCNQGGGFG